MDAVDRRSQHGLCGTSVVARPSHDSDRLHYFRIPYGGHCPRSRKEQLRAHGFWLAVKLPPHQIIPAQRLTPSLACCKFVSCVSSHHPLVGVVCRISRFGKRMGRVRRWQLLRRHTLDLTMTVWVDKYPGERDYTVIAAVSFSLRRELVGHKDYSNRTSGGAIAPSFFLKLCKMKSETFPNRSLT
jgi:hypothetical protein